MLIRNLKFLRIALNKKYKNLNQKYHTHIAVFNIVFCLKKFNIEIRNRFNLSIFENQCSIKN